MKALRCFVLAAAMVAASVPAATAKPDADSTAAMVAAINKSRTNHGLRALREAPKLNRTATDFSRHLMRTDRFTHGSSYARAGFRRAGEILAMSRGWNLKPRSAIRLWLRSPGHRSLMLSSSFRYIGVSPARGYFRGSRTTIWVAHFGAH